MTLHLVQLVPDSAALVRFAHRAGLPEDDPGYLWHRALRDAFGTIAPQPFRSLDPTRGSDNASFCRPAHAQPTRLLGYGPAGEDRLREALTLAAPDLDRVFPPDRIQSKELPLPFAAGKRLAFETRVCPIVRTKSSDGTRQRELDAFVHHALGIADEPRPEREPVYYAWLEDRLAAAGCRLVTARVTSFRLGPLVRRRHASPETRRATEDERARRLLATGRRAAARRPEVVFDGVLEVTEPETFASSLTRGIGRHRAFGFGMLLLRPA
jgi:CRISPR system Cascade subunit CasE